MAHEVVTRLVDDGYIVPDAEFQRGYTAGFDDATEAPLATQQEAHPGEPHEFRTTCQRCGEAGYLYVAVITNGEVVTIADRASGVETKT